MRKARNRLDLLGSMASMFSLNIPLFASKSDDHVESIVKQSYVFKSFLKNDDIQMLYENGVVTLTGTVSEESHKSLAQEIVANLRGVTEVKSRLEENGEIPDAYTDAWLITKVKSTLRFHQNLNTTDLEIIAQDGIVTLRGKARNLAQKNLTTEYAKDVEGVNTVNNEMTIQNEMPRAGDQPIAQASDMAESIDDLSITALVKTTLLYHRSMSALNITVETKDGVVKLDGKARNWTEKNRATKLALDVYGVKMVFNTMIIERIAAMHGSAGSLNRTDGVLASTVSRSS